MGKFAKNNETKEKCPKGTGQAGDLSCLCCFCRRKRGCFKCLECKEKGEYEHVDDCDMYID